MTGLKAADDQASVGTPCRGVRLRDLKIRNLLLTYGSATRPYRPIKIPNPVHLHEPPQSAIC
jgi:hypothetical protein